MKTVYIDKTPISINSKDLIGEGGEAEVFKIGRDTVLKLFKGPDHPCFRTNTPEAVLLKEAAKRRINECQEKLKYFPYGVTPRVVEPQQLVFDSYKPNRKFIGYTMPLISPGYSLHEYARRDFREAGGISLETVVDIFKDLHETVIKLHDRDVIIGDFNQLNVLIAAKHAYLIDADSMQFNKFHCHTYSPRYADPLILDRNLQMTRTHSRETDWYAYAVLLFECLLHVHPYGGVYKPASKLDRLSWEERIVRRVSVLHSDVRYPAVANPIDTFPNEIIQFYENLLQNDVRIAFPLQLLETICTPVPITVFNGAAGAVPVASVASATSSPPHMVPQLSTAGGVKSPYAVTAGSHNAGGPPSSSTPAASLSRACNAASREVFNTRGVILKVAFDRSALRYVYHEDGWFVREDGRAFMKGDLDPSMKFAICGSTTICGKNGKTFVFGEDSLVTPLRTDTFRGQEPVFDANNDSYFFVEHGQLFRSSPDGPKLIDEVFTDQTRIWTGPTFGFGYFLAGEFRRAFLFDNNVPGRSLVDIFPLQDKLLNVQCRFSKSRLWLIVTAEKNGQVINRIAAIGRTGEIDALTEAPEHSGLWLDSVASSCASTFPTQSGGNIDALLIATPDGVIRVETQGAQIVETKQYPATASLVQPGDHLAFTKAGLYTWSANSIRLITTT